MPVWRQASKNKKGHFNCFYFFTKKKKMAQGWLKSDHTEAVWYMGPGWIPVCFPVIKRPPDTQNDQPKSIPGFSSLTAG